MIGHALRWSLSAADRGDMGALSMDGEETNLLIPDLYSFEAKTIMCNLTSSLGFCQFRSLFAQRADVMFWRGSTTGIKQQCPIRDLNELCLNDRVEACFKFRNQRGFDMAISRITQVEKTLMEPGERWMMNAGILGQEVSELEFAKYKYYSDIPCNGLDWGTIHKHLIGNLVFRSLRARHFFTTA